AVYGSRFLGRNSQLEWSNDGEWMVYDSHRGPFPAASGHVLTIVNSAGVERDLLPQLPFWSRPLWSPDREWLMVAGYSTTGKQSISRVRALTGEARTIVEGAAENDVVIHIGWGAGGKRILYISRGRKAVVARDIE